MKSSERPVVIPCQVINHRARIGHLDDPLDDFPMGSGKIFFLKLPGVKNISIQYKPDRLDALKVLKQFISPTTCGAQVKIGNDTYIQISSHINHADLQQSYMSNIAQL